MQYPIPSTGQSVNVPYGKWLSAGFECPNFHSNPHIKIKEQETSDYTRRGGSHRTQKPWKVLQRAFSVASNVYRIRWTVDARTIACGIADSVDCIFSTMAHRKLKSTDKEAVSPQFDLTFSGGCRCRWNWLYQLTVGNRISLLALPLGVVPFKMIMRPRAVAQERGGASFKRQTAALSNQQFQFDSNKGATRSSTPRST